MARLLIDSHIFIWLVDGDRRLGQQIKASLADPLNEPWLSIASLWELAIKVSIGKLDPTYLGNGNPMPHLERAGISLLELHLPHVNAAARLLPHHRDPFDRMLIAQAIVEDMTLVTRDRVFEAYDGLRILWA